MNNKIQINIIMINKYRKYKNNDQINNKIKRKPKEIEEQNANKKLKSFNINDILDNNYSLLSKNINIYSLLSINEDLCEPYN